MFVPVVFNDFRPPEETFVFSSSAIYSKKHDKYCQKLIETVKIGKVKAAVTALELSKLKKYVGENTYYKIYSPVWSCKDSVVFCIGKINLNHEYYSQLYSLYINNQIHLSDMSSVLVAIEYMLPLVTNDDEHHWRLQKNFEKIFKERYISYTAEHLMKGGKPKYFEMYTTPQFCKQFL